MSDKKSYGGRARLCHNLSGYEYLRTEFNSTIANEVTSFKTGLSPKEVEIGYRFAIALSKASLDLMEEAEKLENAGDAGSGTDNDRGDDEKVA